MANDDQIFRVSVYMEGKMYRKLKRRAKEAGVAMSQYLKMTLTDKWNNGWSSPKQPQASTSALIMHGPSKELLSELKSVLAQREMKVEEKRLGPQEVFDGWEPYTSKFK